MLEKVKREQNEATLDVVSPNSNGEFSPEISKGTSSGDDSSSNVPNENRSRFSKFFDQYKPYQFESLDPNLTAAERQAIIDAETPMARALKTRHIKMMAIGSCVGTGLFIGTGSALKTGGPAGILIGWAIVGISIYCVVQALGELAVAFPIPGAYVEYNSRFISRSWGFAVAWNIALQWFVVMPLELVAASLTIKYWNDEISPAAWVCIFYVVIFCIHMFFTQAFGETEFICSTIKIVATLGFILFGIVYNAGGVSGHGYIGGKYFYNPGAFANGFKGVCSVFVTAAFSFSGTELTGLTAAETPNPRKTLPSAIKQVFWRILFFYFICLLMIGLLVPYNDTGLLGSSGGKKASPFVLAIQQAGVKGLPSVFNAVIMIAVFSVANAAVFACSRTVNSIAQQGFAPKIFSYIDRRGRPIVAVVATLIIGLLCFLAASKYEETIFNWMMAISGLCSIFTWGSICFCHIRFRRALAVQGHSIKELAYVANTGLIGSYFAILIMVLILIAQFWVALFPIGGKPDPSTFFQAYLTVPVMIVFYILYFAIFREFKLLKRAEEIDITTDRRQFDIDLLEQEIAEEKALFASKPFYYRFYRLWC
ncbi:hypothetical protein B5S33_g2499 [[Candida] boidinii]|nr:hypothetical protein B5S30_g1931 [[Candida] boidinii]OWB83864.1 hypothetical protein B5S33_g2499 [[Candida] boidinii]